MSYATINPSTGETEQTFATHTPAEVEARLAQAYAAYQVYRTTTYAERARHLVAGPGRRRARQVRRQRWPAHVTGFHKNTLH